MEEFTYDEMKAALLVAMRAHLAAVEKIGRLERENRQLRHELANAVQRYRGLEYLLKDEGE